MGVKTGKLLLRFFKSVKLALILIAYLVVTSIVATLIPQGRGSAFYSHEFSPILARLITALSLDNFFRSFLFLVPAAIFFVNLTVCTVYRLVTRIKRRAKLRIGPDIIHMGLIVLMLAGVITLFGRREGSIFLAPGDSVKIPGGYELTLNSFTYEVYRDGRPKEWVSKVVFRKDSGTVKSYAIQVNRPLKAAGINIFQYSYRDLSEVTLENLKEGKKYLIHPGNVFKVKDKTFRLMQVSTNSSGLITEVNPKPTADEKTLRVMFLVTDNTGLSGRRIYKVGDKIDDYTIKDAVPRLETGLRIISDPGFVPILIGLLLIVTGLVLAFYQKMKDKE